MADVFLRDDVRALLDGAYILIFGGSNMRALYKDLVTLFNENRLMSDRELKRKLEPSYLGDSLVHSIGLTKGRNFKEHRVFSMNDIMIEYYFITKCLCDDVTDTLNGIHKKERRSPDVVVMNSTLWDITRWGSKSVALFKENMKNLIEQLKNCLPPNTLVIWLTTSPISQPQIYGGLLVPEVEFLKHTMRFDAVEANVFAQKLFSSQGFDVLDLHYYLRMNVHMRIEDGVHWQPKAVRFITNLLLTHVSLALYKSLPGNFASVELENLREDCDRPLFPNVTKHVSQLKRHVTPQWKRLNNASPLKVGILGENMGRTNFSKDESFYQPVADPITKPTDHDQENVFFQPGHPPSGSGRNYSHWNNRQARGNRIANRRIARRPYPCQRLQVCSPNKRKVLLPTPILPLMRHPAPNRFPVARGMNRYRYQRKPNRSRF